VSQSQGQTALPAESVVSFVASEFLNPTTLAVLIDQPTTLRVTSDKASLFGKMRYAYLTGWFVITEQEVGQVRDPSDPERETRELTGLTDLVNRQMGSIVERYGPLARIVEYARLVALLRWAASTERLAYVDLSMLGPVVARSSEMYPTPDAIME
jgi:hypothetical protein